MNTEELRQKLLDYVGPAAFSGMSAAFGDLLEIEDADYNELFEIAKRLGVNIDE